MLATADDWVLAVDATLEGVDFAPDVAPRRAARKALLRSLSDLAAVGAYPVGFLATVSLPGDAGEETAADLLEGFGDVAVEYGLELLGGETKRSPCGILLDVTAIGRMEGRRPIERSGARPGDRLCVTGRLGGAALGRHLDFRPRIEAGRVLAAEGPTRASACIDLSDGLARDARRLAAASGVGLEIEASRLPVSDDARELARRTGRPAWLHALADGEDYELLFAVRPSAVESLRQRDLGVAFTPIGRVVTPDRGVVLVDPEGKRGELPEAGWIHRFGGAEGGT